MNVCANLHLPPADKAMSAIWHKQNTEPARQETKLSHYIGLMNVGLWNTATYVHSFVFCVTDPLNLVVLFHLLRGPYLSQKSW